MGRWLLNAVLVLFVIGAVVRGGGALHLWRVPDFSGTHKQTMAQCLEEGASGFESALAQAGMPAANARLLSSAKLSNALRPLCKEWVHNPKSGALTQETGPRFVSQLFREHPSVYQPLCLAGMNADIAANGPVFQYLTKKERFRLSRETCRLQAKYMSKDKPVPDFSALIAQHPDVYVVGCGAVLQAEMARIDVVRQKFTRPEVRRIARRSCTKALRSGLIDASHARGLLDYSVDQQALNKIILRVAQAEARAKA